MGFQTFVAPQFLEVQVVAGTGEDGVHRNLAGYPVIAVPGQVLAVGLGTQHDVRPHLAYLSDQLLSELVVVLQFAVGVVEQHQLLDPQRFRRIGLFLLTHLGEVGGSNVGVSGALAAVGAQHDPYRRSLSDPFGDGPGAPEFGVVGVRGHDQNTLGGFVNRH